MTTTLPVPAVAGAGVSPVDQALHALAPFRDLTRDEVTPLLYRWRGAWMMSAADLAAVLAEFPVWATREAR